MEKQISHASVACERDSAENKGETIARAVQGQAGGEAVTLTEVARRGLLQDVIWATI